MDSGLATALQQEEKGPSVDLIPQVIGVKMFPQMCAVSALNHSATETNGAPEFTTCLLILRNTL